MNINTTWKLLTVHSNASANKATKLVVEKLSFMDKQFCVLEAFSLKKAKRILLKNTDIAIVIIPVILERKSKGIELIHFIRRDLKNKKIRIILRTGYPNSLPEKEVTKGYEIDSCLSEEDPDEDQLKFTVLNTIQIYHQTQQVTNYMKGLAGSIAHEMRHPLSISKGALENVKEIIQLHKTGSNNNKIELSKTDLEGLMTSFDLIERSSSRANMVIDMILNNMKGETIAKEESEILSISEVIKTAINEFAFRETEIDKIKIGDIDHFFFKGDKNSMIFVLFNLLKNALNYVPSDIGEIHIWAETHPSINQLYFKDNGAGISKDKLAVIFDSFVSFDKKEGTGLGLHYCKQVMLGLGGDIKCESVVGSETTFILEFPHLEPLIKSRNKHRINMVV